MPSWFERTFGFREVSAENVRHRLRIANERLICPDNGRSWQVGRLSTPSLNELRKQIAGLSLPRGRLRLREYVGDIREVLANPDSAGTTFQVASQFNLLEMVGPTVSPDAGITNYERDRTQGPACAIACGAGTVYRNYFVPVGNGVGQTEARQIDCLRDFGESLHGTSTLPWRYSNGYVLPSKAQLAAIDHRLSAMTLKELEVLRGRLRIGIQADTQVTLEGCTHEVTQLFCSALPIAYSRFPAKAWAQFARIVLEAAYEASFLSGLINSTRTGSRSLYLTLLGGGAFGNELAWIISAIRRSLDIVQGTSLDVCLVSYGGRCSAWQQLKESYS